MKKTATSFIVGIFLFSIFTPDALAIEEAEPSLGIQSQYVTLSKPGKDVFVKNQRGEWVAAEDGMVLLPGDEVKTDQGSSVEVILDSGKVGHIKINEGSLFTVLRAEKIPGTGTTRTLLDLAVGKIMVKAETLKGNSKFQIQTPTSITGVRGTLFEVEVEEGLFNPFSG